MIFLNLILSQVNPSFPESKIPMPNNIHEIPYSPEPDQSQKSFSVLKYKNSVTANPPYPIIKLDKNNKAPVFKNFVSAMMKKYTKSCVISHELK